MRQVVSDGSLRWAPSFALSAAVLLALVFESIQAAGGELIYALDDPYIHLALARSIQQGSYGINPGEWASPSSSILWPFLLTLAPPRWMEWTPLLINAVACLLSVQVLREVLRGTGLPGWAQGLGALAVAFGINAFGVVMTGMEHSLQVLLALFVAWRLVEERFDGPFYLALGLMPLVRYECLAISLPVAAYVFWTTKDKVRPVVCVLLMLSVMAAFSLTLQSKGLPWLPSSVLAKAAERSLYGNLRQQPMFLVMVAWLGYTHLRDGRYLRYGALILAPVGAFLLLGRMGWFGRYEVFLAGWLAVFTLQTVFAGRWQKKGATAAPAFMCVVLAVCFPNLWLCTLLTPSAVSNIAEQQAVMARVARELEQPVAVNDLGLVAWRSGNYVLDLWGLASTDALDARLNGLWSGVWIESLMAGKGVEYAFLYKDWFPPLPNYWFKVGELVLEGVQASAAGERVALMARTPEAARKLRTVLARLTTEDPRLGRLIRVGSFPGGPGFPE